MIKKKFGCCVSRNISHDETIEVPGMGGRKPKQLPRQILGEILEPRMEEIFSLINREIKKAEMENVIASGMVITGGSALLEGTIEVAESVFNLPTRMGRPRGITGLVDVVNNPMFATGVGLVLYGARNQASKKFRIRDKNIFNRLMVRMKRWFNEVV
jgi:cell division protein FtsA